MKFIRELEHLLFPVFIKCIADNDYSGLVLEGEATEIEMWLAWQDLLSKFYAETDDKRALAYIKRLAKIEALHTRINHLSALVVSLEQLVDCKAPHMAQKLAACFAQWGIKRELSIKTLKSDIQYINNTISNDRVNLLILQREHENADNKATNAVSPLPPKKYWYKRLHAIEQYKKMTFDTNTLNMYRFALYIGELEEYIKTSTIKNVKKNGTKQRSS